jgi:hypothetical protein
LIKPDFIIKAFLALMETASFAPWFGRKDIVAGKSFKKKVEINRLLLKLFV